MATDTTASITSIRSQVPPELHYPRVLIQCGTNLSGIGNNLQEAHIIRYDTIAGFATCTVPGHPGQLMMGFLGSNKVPVAVMCGSFHVYEGYSPSQVTYHIRVMAKMGAKQLILTNAAGSLTPKLCVGTIVTIGDHLAFPVLTGVNPFLGFSGFLSVSDVYSWRLRSLAYAAANSLDLGSAYAEGTSAYITGPVYETPAEARFLQSAGADVVSMSSVLEAIVGKQMGMEVLNVSVVADIVPAEPFASGNLGIETRPTGKPTAPSSVGISHQAVTLVCEQKAPTVCNIIVKVVDQV